MKTIVNKAFVLALTVCIGAVSLSFAHGAQTLSKEEKAINFESGRIALFEIGSNGKPNLTTYTPAECNKTTHEFVLNRGILNLIKKTSVAYDANKIAEESFEGSSKKAFDKVFRSDSEKPEINPLVDVYNKSIPTWWRLSVHELPTIISNMRRIFTDAGILPTDKKPLLIIMVDGSTIDFDMSTEDTEFMNSYFTIASFTDEDIRKFFFDCKNDMVRFVRATMGNDHKEYVTDGVFGSISRQMNKGFKDFKSAKVAGTVTSKVVEIVGIAALAAILARPIGKLIGTYVEPNLPDVFSK